MLQLPKIDHHWRVLHVRQGHNMEGCMGRNRTFTSRRLWLLCVLLLALHSLEELKMFFSLNSLLRLGLIKPGKSFCLRDYKGNLVFTRVFDSIGHNFFPREPRPLLRGLEET